MTLPTIYELGFDPLLNRGLPELPNTLQSSISDNVSTSVLGSGEMVGNYTIKDGYFQSSNFVSGSAGWQLSPTSVELNVPTAVKEIAIGTSPDWFKVDVSGNIWSGNATLAGAKTNNFAVEKEGLLYCKGATIDGTSTIDGKSASGFSTVIDDGVAPEAPTGLTADSGVQGVFLNWTSNTETDLDHYEIWRGTVDNSASAAKIADVKVSMAWDSDLTAGTPYYYWLKAVDRLENTSAFNATSGTSATPRNVGESDVDDNAITKDKINVANLAAISADIGTVTAGNITLDTSGFIRAGQTNYDTGTGFFLGYSGSDYKFSIGSPAGNYLTWDGQNLTLKGTLELSAPFRNIAYTVANLPIPPTTEGFNNPSAYE